MLAVRTTALHHQFDRRTVLDAIALEVPEGSIYGFLGPNGAGKSTALRLLLGLLRPQRGEIEILGRSLARDRREILRRVGSVIEAPAYYEQLTGEENLRVQQGLRGIPRARIDAVLRETGLVDARHRRVGRYSLGMKQRLAIAIALLHEPELLILDEPSNGLDPNGMVELRELMVALNRSHGITVLVSSHLIGEVERMATHVGVLALGRLVAQGPLSTLRADPQAPRPVELRTADDAAALRWLGTRVSGVVAHRHGVRLPALRPDEVAALNRGLVSEGIEVHELRVIRADLEEAFLDLIRPGAAA